jgi:hypothetical protein
MNAKLQVVSRSPIQPVNIERLARLGPGDLRRLYREVFGSNSTSTNSEHLRRQIACRAQVDKEGGLPASARQRALSIAKEAGARIRIGRKTPGLEIPHATVTQLVSGTDARLPLPGSLIVKEYKGRTIMVRALDEGFEYDSRRFTSLTAVAKDITGTKWNGFAFFGLTKERSSGR